MTKKAYVSQLIPHMLGKFRSDEAVNRYIARVGWVPARMSATGERSFARVAGLMYQNITTNRIRMLDRKGDWHDQTNLTPQVLIINDRDADGNVARYTVGFDPVWTIERDASGSVTRVSNSTYIRDIVRDADGKVLRVDITEV